MFEKARLISRNKRYVNCTEPGRVPLMFVDMVLLVAYHWQQSVPSVLMMGTI
jgi:hypothetical protein